MTCRPSQLFLTEIQSETFETFGNQRFILAMEQIKRQITRENITFVRFEATDLHGVSRSKTVPVRFFHVICLSLAFGRKHLLFLLPVLSVWP